MHFDLNWVNLTGIVAFALALIAAFYAGSSTRPPEGPALVLAALVCTSVGALFLAPVGAALAAAMVGLVLAAGVVLAAGGPERLRTFEWIWLVGEVAAFAGFGLGVAWLRPANPILASIVSLVLALGLFLVVLLLRVSITPILFETRYLKMSDGTRIAASLYLPRNRKQDERLPTILSQNRYHRSDDFKFPYNILLGPGPTATPFIDPMVKHGYAYVITDVRGSGASFGVQQQPFSPRELEDGGEIIDWIVAQPWSNGRVGAEGVSYNGTAAELLLTTGRPQVKAVMLMFTAYDAYGDILFPGGIFLQEFARRWGLFTQALDADDPGKFAAPSVAKLLGSVTPAGPRGRTELAQAVRQHRQNLDFYKAASQLSFRDDVADGYTPLAMSAYRRQAEIGRSGAAVYAVTGWLDGGYQNAGLNRFLTMAKPGDHLLIGPWAHGAAQIERSCHKAPVKFDAVPIFKAFFDSALKDAPRATPSAPEITYYTLCAEQWRTTRSWPPAGTLKTFYLADRGALADMPPTDQNAADAYIADPRATSGDTSRWISYVNFEHKKIGYPDRKAQDALNLVYTSAPLARDTETTGRPTVELHLASTQPDGAVFVYLEDVSPNGDVAYVTEGELRLAGRTPAREAPYKSTGIYRSFDRADSHPMTPGERVEVTIELLPTSYLFRQGHRMRLSIAGADKDNFAQINTSPPEYRIFRDAAGASRLTFNVIDTTPEHGEPSSPKAEVR